MKSTTIRPVVKRIHNLCPVPDRKNAFRPTGAPKTIIEGNPNILASISHNLLIVSDNDGLASLDTSTGHKSAITTTEAICADSISDSRIVAMSTNGPFLADQIAGGGFSLVHAPHAEFNPVTITAEPMAPLTIHIDSLELSTVYSPGDDIKASDRNKVLNAARNAYSALVSLSTEQGVLFQPVTVRAVLRDADGNCVWRGPEILVMPPAGAPFSSPINIDLQTDNRTAAVNLPVPSYRLRVTAEPMTEQIWINRAATLQIVVSPCFHTWTNNANSGTVTVTRQQINGTALLVTLPGSERGLSPSEHLRNRRLLDAMSTSNAGMTTLKVVDNPFATGTDTIVGTYGSRG